MKEEPDEGTNRRNSDQSMGAHNRSLLAPQRRSLLSRSGTDARGREADNRLNRNRRVSRSVRFLSRLVATGTRSSNASVGPRLCSRSFWILKRGPIDRPRESGNSYERPRGPERYGRPEETSARPTLGSIAKRGAVGLGHSF